MVMYHMMFLFILNCVIALKSRWIMSKNLIKKVYQSFNFIADNNIEENLEFYKAYIKYTTKEIAFSEFCEERISFKDILSFIKDISDKYPYLILSFVEVKSEEKILKHTFWNGEYLFDEIRVYKLFSNLKLPLGNYFSIFFDISSIDYFGDFIYFHAIKESGKIFNTIENKFSENNNLKEIFKNGNLITRSQNFNISEVLHVLTCKIEA